MAGKHKPISEDSFYRDVGRTVRLAGVAVGWTSTDEAFWKENYRIEMAPLRELRNGAAWSVPVAYLKVLYPTGVDEIRDGKTIHSGGVEWTIKDGIPYYAPGLLADVKEIVSKARGAQR